MRGGPWYTGEHDSSSPGLGGHGQSVRGPLGFEPDDLPVKSLGLHEVALAMTIDCPLKSLLNRGHLNLVVVLCVAGRAASLAAT